MTGPILTIEETREVKRKRNICICRFCRRCYKKGRKKVARLRKVSRLTYQGCKLCDYPIVSLEACVLSGCGEK